MTILNTISISQLTFFGYLIIGIGIFCSLIATGGALIDNRTVVIIGAILLLIDAIFGFVSALIFKVPFEEPTGRHRYEVTIEDIEAVRNYKIIEQRGNIYTIEELTEDELPALEEANNDNT